MLLVLLLALALSELLQLVSLETNTPDAEAEAAAAEAVAIIDVVMERFMGRVFCCEMAESAMAAADRGENKSPGVVTGSLVDSPS
jgi:hypothetical protein